MAKNILGYRTNWQYFVEDANGNIKNIMVLRCIKPDRTKIWKSMQRWLSENPFADFEIEKIGYKRHSIEPGSKTPMTMGKQFNHVEFKNKEVL